MVRWCTCPPVVVVVVLKIETRGLMPWMDGKKEKKEKTLGIAVDAKEGTWQCNPPLKPE